VLPKSQELCALIEHSHLRCDKSVWSLFRKVDNLEHGVPGITGVMGIPGTTMPIQRFLMQSAFPACEEVQRSSTAISHYSMPFSSFPNRATLPRRPMT
jgi:hypothetical protein